MSQNIVRKLKTTKSGFLIKRLCCNCLSEERIIHPIKGWWKCRGCGAINDKIIVLYIHSIPEITGQEL